MVEITDEIIKGDPKILDGLEKLCPDKDAVRHTTDSFGNAYHWFALSAPQLILDAAGVLSEAGARLAIIAAYNKHKNDRRAHNVCYEFVAQGIVYAATVHLGEECDSVPSIARIFANADWHEREMMELYGVRVTGNPNPRRLFLDDELDKGLLGEIVPLSIMMNGASSTELWERILSDKGAK